MTPDWSQIPPETRARWERLLALLREMGSAAVAFSGGVDSALLAAAAHQALGERMLAVTIQSAVESAGDVDAARQVAGQLGFPWRVTAHDDLCTPGFAENSPDRCYVCKYARFTALKMLARTEGLAWVVEGSNADDRNDYRPGMRAVQALGVRSPLLECDLTKAEIRLLAKALGLPVWSRPSAPCLATRFPYGTEITREGLARVKQAEAALRDLGFEVARVRVHGQAARIEAPAADLERLFAQRHAVSDAVKAAGFAYAALDLDGYRQGSLNEVLSNEVLSSKERGS